MIGQRRLILEVRQVNQSRVLLLLHLPVRVIVHLVVAAIAGVWLALDEALGLRSLEWHVPGVWVVQPAYAVLLEAPLFALLLEGDVVFGCVV